MKIKITSDSTCDLSPELIERYNIGISHNYVVKDGKNFKDGLEITPQEIYDHVDAGGDLCGTAAVSVVDYLELFRPILEDEGYDAIIHINISSEISCCYQNACIAGQEFPGRIFPIDSRSLSSGQGHIVIEAAEQAAQGKTPEEIVEYLKEFVERVDASFVLHRLDYMKKGGRCSSIALLGANLLKLYPCIVLENGQMHAEKKYRGVFKNCILEYINDRLSVDTPIRKDRIFVTHSGIAQEIEDAAVAKVREMGFENIYVTRAGCTVCGHCGPNTLGVLYIKA